MNTQHKTNHQRVLLISVGAAFLLFAGAVSAQTTDDQTPPPTGDVDVDKVDPQEAEKKIRILLSAYHEFPSKEELLDVSPEATTILVNIAEDDEALPTMRSRAIDALGFFDDEISQQYLSSLLANSENVEDRLVHHAITAYSKAFKGQSLEVVQPFLAHDDTQMRMTAVVAVQKHGGKSGVQLLEKRLKVEKNTMVREEIQDLIRNPVPVQ